MKKTLLFFIALWVFNSNAQLPFSEDFSNGIPVQWTNLYSGWEIDNIGESFPTALNGYVKTSLSTMGFRTLTTNSIDMSGVTNNINLSFYYSFVLGGNHSVKVQLSSDNGTNWNDVAELTSGSNIYFEEDITALVNNSSEVQIRFSFTYISGAGFSTMAFDDLEIYEVAQNDLGVVQILSPNSGCSLGDETVTVKVKNYGSNIVATGTPIEYSIDGTTWVSENTTSAINSGEELNFTFAQTLDLSTPDSYVLQVRTALSGDEVTANDLISTTIINQESIIVTEANPYTEDFENDNGNFVSGQIDVANSWEWGAPNSTHLSEGANGSTNVWATNLTGDYVNYEKSYVETPCFDLSALSLPVFELDAWYNAENSYQIHKTIMRVEYTLDYGITWEQIGTASPNWYEDINGFHGLSNGWKHKKIDIPSLANQVSVKFRLYFEENHEFSQPTEGFAFDNIYIHEKSPIDVGISEWIEPMSGCGLTANEMVKIRVENFGTVDLTNIPVAFSIDGGITFFRDTITATITPGNSIAYPMYLSPVDFSASGMYNCIAKTELSTDGNSVNDEISIEIRSKASYTGEYTEDFEGANAGNDWFTYSAINSPNDWVLATPSTTVLNSAASGTKAWVTNAYGVYQTNQESYVESPCFDLSDLSHPALSFKVKSDLNGSSLFVSYSIDGGDNWTVINQNPSQMPSNNWYQAPYSAFYDVNINSTSGYDTKYVHFSILMK